MFFLNIYAACCVCLCQDFSMSWQTYSPKDYKADEYNKLVGKFMQGVLKMEVIHSRITPNLPTFENPKRVD